MTFITFYNELNPHKNI